MGKLTHHPPGTPLPDGHPFKNGAIFIGGAKPMVPTGKGVTRAEEFFLTEYGRKPTGNEAIGVSRQLHIRVDRDGNQSEPASDT